MRLISLALMGLFVAAPVHASVYKDFVRIWDARDKTYRSERAALESRAQASAERAINALIVSDPAAPEDLVLALTAAWSLSELVGRGQMLHVFREHMAEKPSAALSEIWLQGKVDELRRRQAETDLIEREMEILKGRDTTSVKTWIAALERLSMIRGSLSGEASELALIDQNLVTYYRARSEERAEAHAGWAAVLLTLAGAAQASQRDTQHRSAACARTGNCGKR